MSDINDMAAEMMRVSKEYGELLEENRRLLSENEFLRSSKLLEKDKIDLVDSIVKDIEHSQLTAAHDHLQALKNLLS
jgi:hypothetical protein